MNINFLMMNEKYAVEIKDPSDKEKIFIEYPINIQLLGGRNKKGRYDTVEEKDGKFIASSEISVNMQNKFQVIDQWTDCGQYVQLDRKIACIVAEKEWGIRCTIDFRCNGTNCKTFDDYQFIIPGALYNKNDTDMDGQDDYLGTYIQDYKDDRNPSLSIACFLKQDKRFISLIRADKPVKDSTINREQIEARHFIHDTDIGSLGVAPSPYKTSEIILRCDYPFYERATFCLNVDTSEWAAYKRMETGSEVSMSYILLTGNAINLTEASWKTTTFQMDRILNHNIKHPFELEEVIQYRRELLHNSFRDFPDKKHHPCGYVCHFSPREKFGNKNVLEYGFSGNQTMVCYEMLRAYRENGNEEYKHRALETIRFFVDQCIDESGLPNAMYSVDKEQFVYWWTGVLMPFQYSSDREELEKFIGSQVVGALMDIAEKLKGSKGNYCRTMVEAMYYLMLCYENEKKYGAVHNRWYQTVKKFCDKMVEIQNENGSWNRAYTMCGEPIIYPTEWFGKNELEQGSGSIFPTEVLILMYQDTGDFKYLESAVKAADFILENYVENVMYLGGLNDTTHKKSVKIDAVSVMYNMRTLLLVYENTKKEKYLYGAKSAAQILASWTYIWNIPFDKNTLLGENGFETTGWAGCDVIPACSYVDDEFVEFVPDLLRVATYCKDEKLAILGKIVTLGMQHGLSMPQRMYGYTMPGIQCEGFMTSLWLTDTNNLLFSGAVAKNKGDDNDTCNGLINGQALYNLENLLDRYQTLDFDKIIEQVLA